MRFGWNTRLITNTGIICIRATLVQTIFIMEIRHNQSKTHLKYFSILFRRYSLEPHLYICKSDRIHMQTR